MTITFTNPFKRKKPVPKVLPVPEEGELRVLLINDKHEFVSEALGITDERLKEMLDQAKEAMKHHKCCVADVASRITGLKHANEVFILGLMLGDLQRNMMQIREAQDLMNELRKNLGGQ